MQAVVLFLMICGSGMVAAVLALLLLWYNKKKKKNKDTPSTPTYTYDNSGSGSGSSNSGGVGTGWGGGPLLATFRKDGMRIVITKGMGAGAAKPKIEGESKFVQRPFPISNGGVVVSFQIKFVEGFEWSCGGKIGGLFIGTGSASGCVDSSNGASHRVNFGKDGGLQSYVYVPKGSLGQQPPELSNQRDCGQGVFKSELANSFKAGEWYTVHCGVKLNTVGKRDGRLLVGVNKTFYTLNGVVWRLSNLPITSFKIAPFHGGGCTASRQSVINVQNIRVYRWD